MRACRAAGRCRRRRAAPARACRAGRSRRCNRGARRAAASPGVSQRGLPWIATGAPGAERAAHPAADRTNLLRVMPAKGIHSTPASGFDVAVVGGGVIGLSVAWRVRARGLSVVVLDRGEFGAATTRV